MSDFFCRIHGWQDNLRESILKHLELLFNQRKGSMIHMPDYGLAELLCNPNKDDGSDSFKHSLCTIIEQYEPRIKIQSLEHVDDSAADSVVQIRLKATLNRLQLLSFDARLLQSGEVVLSECYE